MNTEYRDLRYSVFGSVHLYTMYLDPGKKLFITHLPRSHPKTCFNHIIIGAVQTNAVNLALVNKNWTEQVPKPRIKRRTITPQDAILDRTLRNDLQGSPTARNSSASNSQYRRRIINSIVSQEPVKDEPLSAVAALLGAAGFLRLRIYQQFKAGAKRSRY